MEHYFFDDYIEFVNLDSRTSRTWHAPVSAESLSLRHETMLPRNIIKNKTVLDLGSWISATGQWCLAHGAAHYTGVEIQSSLASVGEELLSKYWSNDRFKIINTDLEQYLDQCIASNISYDIVLFVGVIQSFLNTFEILKKVSSVGKIVILDGPIPRDRFSAQGNYIEIVKNMASSSADSSKNYEGAGIKISPGAVNIMMETLGFFNYDGLLYPKKLSDSSVNDVYNDKLSLINLDNKLNLSTTVLDNHQTIIPSEPFRFLARFVKSSSPGRMSLKDSIKREIFKTPQKFSKNIWAFNEQVAETFYEEAYRHIPDYHRVVNLCLECIESNFLKKDIPIIDVGSATGFTINYLKNHGYTNVAGVEKSQDMINNSFHKDHIVHSDKLPTGPWTVVLANWTLHFIKQRKEYLESIYNNLHDSGMLILTDKMDHTLEIEKLYHRFKQDQGVDLETIQAKKTSLVGVLDCYPINWYIETLQNIGFKDIQIINSKYMFHTIYARK